MTKFTRIGVLGAGAWGTALAASLHQQSSRDISDIPVWALEGEVADALRQGQGNPIYLPGVDLPKMAASTDIAAMAGCDAVLAVVPAQFARSTLEALGPHLSKGTPVLLCAKGIERSSLSFMASIDRIKLAIGSKLRIAWQTRRNLCLPARKGNASLCPYNSLAALQIYKASGPARTCASERSSTVTFKSIR